MRCLGLVGGHMRDRTEPKVLLVTVTPVYVGYEDSYLSADCFCGSDSVSTRGLESP